MKKQYAVTLLVYVNAYDQKDAIQQAKNLARDHAIAFGQPIELKPV